MSSVVQNHDAIFDSSLNFAFSSVFFMSQEREKNCLLMRFCLESWAKNLRFHADITHRNRTNQGRTTSSFYSTIFSTTLYLEPYYMYEIFLSWMLKYL